MFAAHWCVGHGKFRSAKNCIGESSMEMMLSMRLPSLRYWFSEHNLLHPSNLPSFIVFIGFYTRLLSYWSVLGPKHFRWAYVSKLRLSAHIQYELAKKSWNDESFIKRLTCLCSITLPLLRFAYSTTDIWRGRDNWFVDVSKDKSRCNTYLAKKRAHMLQGRLTRERMNESLNVWMLNAWKEAG